METAEQDILEQQFKIVAGTKVQKKKKPLINTNK
jgi:hypothetical protein